MYGVSRATLSVGPVLLVSNHAVSSDLSWEGPMPFPPIRQDLGSTVVQDGHKRAAGASIDQGMYASLEAIYYSVTWLLLLGWHLHAYRRVELQPGHSFSGDAGKKPGSFASNMRGSSYYHVHHVCSPLYTRYAHTKEAWGWPCRRKRTFLRQSRSQMCDQVMPLFFALRVGV
jgi:hypothetical protein